MNERPILLRGDEVRSILSGNKTMLRRVVKIGHPGTFGRSDTPGYDWTFRGNRRGGTRGDGACHWQDFRHAKMLELCPFGKPGDRLWAKETWQAYEKEPRRFGGNSALSNCMMRIYANPPIQGESVIEYKADIQGKSCGSWRHSVHMPRWASRLVLEVVNVRLERLQGISDSDIKAEGFPSIDAFRKAWDSIYAKRGHGWGQNDYVWVVEFRREKGL
jgi:hypothetical protein